jgi:hypothetical protein
MPIAGRSYHNTGEEAVTLGLSARAFGGDGRPAPQGMFQVTPAQLTVPVGGSATATVTADTRAGDTDGLFSGALLAVSGGTTVVRTALGAEREAESYDLTIRDLDPEGRPAGDAFTSVKGTQAANSSVWRTVEDADGEVTVRLPRGRYALQGTVYADAGSGGGTAVLVRPRLDLTADATVVMDARTAGPVGITAPDPRAASTERLVSYEVAGPHGFGILLPPPPGVRALPLRRKRARGAARRGVRAVRGEPHRSFRHLPPGLEPAGVLLQRVHRPGAALPVVRGDRRGGSTRPWPYGRADRRAVDGRRNGVERLRRLRNGAARHEDGVPAARKRRALGVRPVPVHPRVRTVRNRPGTRA